MRMSPRLSWKGSRPFSQNENQHGPGHSAPSGRVGRQRPPRAPTAIAPSRRRPADASPGRRRRERDTSGVNALVATEFFYFGRSAIPISPRFAGMLAQTQGHKNTRDRDKSDRERIERFWDWISKEAPRSGRIDYPSDFTEDGCRRQCSEIEADDIEEA